MPATKVLTPEITLLLHGDKNPYQVCHLMFKAAKQQTIGGGDLPPMILPVYLPTRKPCLF
jgi:hypothetical protein